MKTRNGPERSLWRLVRRAYHRLAIWYYGHNFHFAATHFGAYSYAEENELWVKLNHHRDRLRDLTLPNR